MQETRDAGSILGLGRSPGGRNGNPAPVFLSEKSHGQRSLAGYSPWGGKESDMTERLNTHTHTHTHTHGNGKEIQKRGDIFPP